VNFSGMSELSLVSRVSPVQTAIRNCARDEGRSFEVGNQVLISSHRKLLSSKMMVVNIAEKAGTSFRQARLSQKVKLDVRACIDRGERLIGLLSP